VLEQKQHEKNEAKRKLHFDVNSNIVKDGMKKKRR
jgi:hypothetical protein